MPNYHFLKTRLRKELQGPDWKEFLDRLYGGGPDRPVQSDQLARPVQSEDLDGIAPSEALGPLMNCLLRHGDLRWRAVYGIGLLTSRLAESSSEHLEKARIIMRRFMWHMNEESGNIGWGVPESMGETMARSEKLADEFGRILLSYVIDTGNDDNYIDYPPLLAQCFWGVGRLAQARPELVGQHWNSLSDGLFHPDDQVAAQACLALRKLAFAAGGREAWRKLDQRQKESMLALNVRTRIRLEELSMTTWECEDFDGTDVLNRQVSHMARELLEL